MMEHDSERSGAAVERFVLGVAAAEIVWGLQGAQGFVVRPPAGASARKALLFWSDRAGAAVAQAAAFPQHAVAELPLFDFLYRWLPGMGKDGVAAVVDPSADAPQLEVSAKDLHAALRAALGPERVAKYDERAWATV